MHDAHAKLLRGQALGGLTLNFALNGAAAWLAFPAGGAPMPLWARGNCVAGDTIGTSFFLPLVTCVVLTAVVRRTLRAGRVPPLSRAALPTVLRAMPRGVLARGALVGLVCAAALAPATLGLLTAAGVTALTRAQLVAFKAVYTALLGLLVTPAFGARALEG